MGVRDIGARATSRARVVMQLAEFASARSANEARRPRIGGMKTDPRLAISAASLASLLALQGCTPMEIRILEEKQQAMEAVAAEQKVALQEQVKRGERQQQFMSSMCPEYVGRPPAQKTVAQWGPLAELSKSHWVADFNGGLLSHQFGELPNTDCLVMVRLEANPALASLDSFMHRLVFRPADRPGKLLLTVIRQDYDSNFWNSSPIEVQVASATTLTLDGGKQPLLRLRNPTTYEAPMETDIWKTSDSARAPFRKLAEDEWKTLGAPYFSALGKVRGQVFTDKLAEAQASVDRAHREKEAAARRRWEMFAAGMAGASRGFAEASVDSRQREATREASLQDLNRQLRASDAARSVSTRPSTATATVAPPAGSAGASTTSGKGTAPSMNAPSTKPQPTDRRQDAAAQPSKLNAYPEAIVACSRPDATGKFICATPVTHMSGGPGDKDWRTPEALVATLDSCKSARALPSATHLVWGCGYGATNNSNTMDRSAGVDVRDRATYYCHPLETSCRRTTP